LAPQTAAPKHLERRTNRGDFIEAPFKPTVRWAFCLQSRRIDEVLEKKRRAALFSGQCCPR
jgi:hypothetical protein